MSFFNWGHSRVVGMLGVSFQDPLKLIALLLRPQPLLSVGSLPPFLAPDTMQGLQLSEGKGVDPQVLQPE